MSALNDQILAAFSTNDKKVLAELNDYIEWERRTKISLKANCIHFVHEILKIKNIKIDSEKLGA